MDRGYTNAISDIDYVTDSPESRTTSDLRRAIHDAEVVYQAGNKSRDWYEQVKRICNAELVRRGEKPQ